MLQGAQFPLLRSVFHTTRHRDQLPPTLPLDLEPDVRDPVSLKGKWSEPGLPNVKFHVNWREGN